MRACAVLACLLAAAAAAAAAPPAGAPAPAPLVAATREDALVVCVVAGSQPLADCTLGSSTARDDFSGFEVEVWRSMAARLQPPLVEGRDYVLRCTTIADALASLRRSDGTCDAGLGAVTATKAREDSGIVFSQAPTFTSSLAVLVPGAVKDTSGWFWVYPFAWGLWLVVGLVVVLFPLLVFAVEALSTQALAKGGVGWRAVARGLARDVDWLTFNTGQVSALSTKLVLALYFVVFVILENSYGATFAAHLTVQQLEASVTNLGALRGQAVGTAAAYTARLARQGIGAIAYSADDIHDAAGDPGRWLDDLKSGALAAFIGDEPMLIRVDRLSGCAFTLLPEGVGQLHYALAFPASGTLAARNWQVEDVLQQMLEDGTMEELRGLHISYPDQLCLAGSETTETFGITAEQLWGLWLVYGVVVVAAVLVALSMFLRRKRAASQAALRVPSGLPGAAPARPAAASRDPEAAVGRQALPATRSERERWLEQEVADIRAALQSTLTRL